MEGTIMKQKFEKFQSGWLMDSDSDLDLGLAFAIAFAHVAGILLETILTPERR